MARHSKYSRLQRSRSNSSRSKISSRACRAWTHRDAAWTRRVAAWMHGLQPGCTGLQPVPPTQTHMAHRTEPRHPSPCNLHDRRHPCAPATHGVVHPGAPRRAHPRGRRALHRARRVRPRAALHTHTAQPAHSPAAAQMTPSVPAFGRARDSGAVLASWHARAHNDACAWYLKPVPYMLGRGLRGEPGPLTR